MIDIEAAFLEAHLDVPVFVEWATGLEELKMLTPEEKTKYCIRLDRAMYGTVDSPPRFFKTLAKHLTNTNGLNMHQQPGEPCVFTKHREGKLILLVVTFVDDILVGGSPEDINHFKNGMS